MQDKAAAVFADYIGCMKTGRIMTSPEWRWYEPQHAVWGEANTSHMPGAAYMCCLATQHCASPRCQQDPCAFLPMKVILIVCASNECIALATAVIKTKAGCCSSGAVSRVLL